MTVVHLIGGERRLAVRYLPVLAWSFAILAGFGIGDIIARMLDGRLAVGAGPFTSIALLGAMTGFILFTGGHLVVATFDRERDAVQITRYGLAGRTVEVRRLSEVAGLDVRILSRAQHRLALRMRSGERLLLTPYYVVSFGMPGVARLSAFLGIEPTMVREERRW